MLSSHAVGLLAIMLITLCVYAWAMFGEGYVLQRLVLGQYSLLTPLPAVALTAFFVLVSGQSRFGSRHEVAFKKLRCRNQSGQPTSDRLSRSDYRDRRSG
jgi:hypothetical protein